VEYVHGSSPYERIDDPVLTRAVLEPQLVHAVSDTSHWSGERHGEHEPAIEPGQGVGKVSTHFLGQAVNLAPAGSSYDDHGLVSQKRDIRSSAEAASVTIRPSEW
jgi:hypothetical protein